MRKGNASVKETVMKNNFGKGSNWISTYVANYSSAI